jgi:hypothetical protein
MVRYCPRAPQTVKVFVLAMRCDSARRLMHAGISVSFRRDDPDKKRQTIAGGRETARKT